MSFPKKEIRGLAAIEKKHNVKQKGFKVVIEELKQRVTAKAAKLKRYEQRINQYRQNRMFQYDQKRLYEELDGNMVNSDIQPDPKESCDFWGSIWENPVCHNQTAEWLKDIRTELQDNITQENVKISGKDVKDQMKKITNWKAPGPDGVQDYWLKYFSSLHVRIAIQLNGLLESNEIPEWMNSGRTLLCVKDADLGNTVENFRPITCLPLMWKLFSGLLAEKMYMHLQTEGLLPDEKKGCRKGSRGTKDQLLIDKMILRNCKRRKTNLAMAWIDYRKAYDMVPHSWILESLKITGVARNVQRLIESSMEKWKTVLTTNKQVLGEVRIRRGIFQGDSLSPLLFVICLVGLVDHTT